MIVGLVPAAILAWGLVAWEDMRRFEINPWFAGAAVVCTTVAAALLPTASSSLFLFDPHWAAVVADRLAGACIGLIAGFLTYQFQRGSIGQGDIYLYAALFAVGGLDHILLTACLFGGFSLATCLVYASIRNKPFFKTGYPAGIPAAAAAVSMIAITFGLGDVFYA